MSEQRARAEGPQASKVSITTCMNEKSPDVTSSAYLAIFLPSALSAADSAAEDEN